MSTTYTYASSVDDTLVAEETVWNMPGEISTTYSRDSLQRPTATTVMQGDYGCKNTFTYVPRQTKKWVSDGFTPIIKSTAVDLDPTLPPITGHWETTDVGTTNYVSAFKEYSISGTTATLVRTDAIEYDSNGNITKYGDVTYEYDNLNRLVRENNPTIDKTTRWWYDINGNITYVSEYAYTTDAEPSNGTTTAFIYGTSWKDQLSVISLGTSSKSIVYDASGNPTSYKGATLTWTRGRLLECYATANNALVATMTYDASGVRKQKTVVADGYTTTTNYIYNGNNLIREIKSGASSYTKTFLYNSQGIIGFIYQGETYTYRKNMFGDIIAIYSGATKLVEYAYDAFGNCTIVSDTGNIGLGNPFRYRSYYWDNDLQLYYLMSRYYDPQAGRFINADSLEYLNPETIGGLNLYAYCGNNPVMGIDPLGTSSSFWNYIKYELGQWWTNTVRQINEILQDIQATVDSLMNNFVLEVGVGYGFGGSINIGKGLSISAGAWMNPLHLLISKDAKDGIALGMRGYAGFSGDIMEYIGLGPAIVDEFKSYSGKLIDNSGQWSSFVGISGAAYFGIGASFSLGFNLDDLLYDLKEIWR